MKFDLTKPCKTCPFRSDIAPFITAERAKEILTSDGDFPCHQTTEFDDEGEECGGDHHHCAGFLILLEKEGSPNQMMRISERLGMYDRRKLDMDAPVYDSIRECVSAHRKVRQPA
jgi:hypothetical protein